MDDESSDRLEFEKLGALRHVWNEGWLGRHMDGAWNCDLVVEESLSTPDDKPDPARLEMLAAIVRNLPNVRERAVGAVCAARSKALNWKDGPSSEHWSLLEARISAHAVPWLTLHEYETDEYSKWCVRLDGNLTPMEVLRVPALPLQGPIAEQGVRVWATQGEPFQ